MMNEIKKHKIEARPYGPESKKEEIEAIRNRAYLYDKNIIMFKEVPVPSIFQLDVMFKEVDKIAKDHQSFFMLIDLTETKRPNAEIRAYLKERFLKFIAKIDHVAIYTDKNFIMNIAAKFVLSNLGFRSFSIHKTKEEALKAIEDTKK